MRVAILVGVLMFNVIVGFYGVLAENANPDNGLSDAQQVHAYEGDVQPPPSWP